MKITRRIERIAEASAEIFGEEADKPGFLHAVLAQCALPYRNPPAGSVEYVRQNGRASIVLQAGMLVNPKTRQLEKQGLPYGSKPRLLMLHLCSEAVRQQSPVVPIADSMTGFMKTLGLRVTGGKTGTIGAFKGQLNRLAATRIQLLYADDDRASMLNAVPIERFDVWFPSDPRQRMLWPSEVQLSAQFFDSLKEHALPLDWRAVRALQHNARALDCYTWLAHRLPRVRKTAGELVSWKALHGQFGGDTKRPKDSKPEMIAALRAALAVYGKARIDEEDNGLRLHRSPPPIAPKTSA